MNAPLPAGRAQFVHGACPHDCPDTCALVTTVVDGIAIKVEGADAHPPTNGVLCTKVAKYLERTYSPDRLLHPMRRTGRKGEGRFERISWDEALDTIAARLKAIAADDPQAILPYSYAGTMGQVQGSSMDRRFFHRLGASLLDRTICSTAGKTGLSYTLGAAIGMDMERFVDAKLIILWGSNPITSTLHLWSRVVEAKRRGAKVIAIDPYRSLSAEKCDQHIALLPGTDGALALGIMHVLVRDGLVDRDYVDRHTVGYDGLVARVAEYPPSRVAELCGLETAVVEKLAREYGTVKPAAIRLNYGMQRTAGGGMAARTIACLPAVVGAWRDPAGGLLLSSSGAYPIDRAALERPDLIRGQPRTINMSTIGDALTSRERPVKAIVVYNSNPVAVAPQSEKVLAGFVREDLFTVVLEHFQTDTADYADIVLPATTQLEHIDIHASYGHLYWMMNNPAIAPMGEAKPNSEIFRLLSRRMGFDEPCFRDSDEDLARAAILKSHARNADIDFDVLRAEGWQRLSVPDTYAPFAEGHFPTPSGKCELYCARLAEQGIDPLPTYHPPHESRETAPELARRYPLAFISPPTRNFLNSSFANIPSLKTIDREQRVELHPADAAARGITDGAMVRVFNDRGAFSARARITDKVRPGLAVGFGVWWHKHTANGRNVNAVTSQQLTDIGRGPTFYDCLVEVAAAG